MLKKRGFYIALFIICLMGLTIVQYQYLRVGLNLAKVQFDRKIGAASESIKHDLSNHNQLTFLMGSAMLKDNSFFKTSVDTIQDASVHFLRDLVASRLVDNGIDTDFSYSLHTRDSTYFLNSPTEPGDNEKMAVYPIELFGYLPGILEKRLVLDLKFKNLNRYFLSKLNGLTLPSLIFLLGIILAIVWALRTYYWQRNLILTTNKFIDNLTHELKTPVFSLGLATKLLEENSTAGQRPIVNIMKQQIKRLSEHIDKVLELGRLEAHKKVFNMQEVDFRPHLKDLCKEFQCLISMEEVSFSFDLEPSKYLIKGEIFHLENAVNNLLDNAKKYSDHPEIFLRAKITRNALKISIGDNGQGIGKKDRTRIFTKYYRVTNGNLHDVKGYGLGLNYVKEVVQAHQGKVSITSEKGKGTEVTISIPTSDGG